MARFFLIDPSLQDIGGHHFEYALHVLRAAEQAGFEIRLATHRLFRADHRMPSNWELRPSFQHTTYTRVRRSAQLERWGGGVAQQATWLTEWWTARRRATRVIAFTRDIAALFSETELGDGDQVFIPTLCEIELAGLAQFLAHDARTRRADWHLQFHYPIYAGCESDYAAQDDQLESLRRSYRESLAQVSGHRIHFYTTTDRLTIQHNRLGIAEFQTLPYPVNPWLVEPRETEGVDREPWIVDRAATPKAASLPSPLAGEGPGVRGNPQAPLCITYLGDARHEKGYHHLPAIVERVWHDYVETGRVRFVLQSDFGFPRPARGKNRAVVEAVDQLRRLASDKVRLLEQPLGSDEYCRFARNSNIGLLLYDRVQYVPRCSGILVELLSAGVPVLVSAGCWLADQLADVNAEYHAALRHDRPALATGRVESGVRLSLPASAAELLLSLRWPAALGATAGAYARIETSSFAADGRLLDRWPTVIGPARDDRLSTALVRLPPGTAAIEFAWRNAYGAQEIQFREVECSVLARDAIATRPTPLGAVGLVAVEPEQASVLLADLIENHAHYRQTAARFARQWSAWHNPDRVLAELLSHRRALPLRPQIVPQPRQIATAGSDA